MTYQTLEWCLALASFSISFILHFLHSLHLHSRPTNCMKDKEKKNCKKISCFKWTKRRRKFPFFYSFSAFLVHSFFQKWFSNMTALCWWCLATKRNFFLCLLLPVAAIISSFSALSACYSWIYSVFFWNVPFCFRFAFTSFIQKHHQHCDVWFSLELSE